MILSLTGGIQSVNSLSTPEQKCIG